jgi:hypothetical protein
VASVGEVAEAVRAAIAQLAAGRAAVLAALVLIEQAGHSYVQLGKGSSRPDLITATACLRTAHDQCREAIAIIDQATDHANSYLAHITGTSTPTEDPPSGNRTAQATEPWRLTREQVERLRGQLPLAITEDKRGTGLKTHGRWVGTDGVVAPITSGEDDWASAADAELRSRGLGQLYVANHAEMKLAAHLRSEHARTGQPQHATIVINNVPCSGIRGCGRLLPVMLPAGCSLTVHAPGYQRTYTGGMRL